MKYKQQNQTKKFFEADAKNWSIKSDFKKNNILNSIQERNFYVLNQLRKYKLNSLLDVGCGTGDLCYRAAKITELTLGIDFAENMIKIAKQKFKKKNLKFLAENFFKIKTNKKFECISANGFIEYLSILDIKKFLDKSKVFLKKIGLIIFGSRNKLFNLYSLNKFSEEELKQRTFRKFYEESILLNSCNFKKFIKIKKNTFEVKNFKQPKTGIEVDIRHQFSPLQIIDLLKKKGLKIIDLHPINYHPVPPSKLSSENHKLFSNSIYLSNEKNKLPYLPFSSSFMVTARKMK